jgi:hypothetical protein
MQLIKAGIILLDGKGIVLQIIYAKIILGEDVSQSALH